ncbi:hypothetical protein SESBI_35979 [Sesbania bispinosa]|nr:hypothetical protein SESBI_35979 [Sesbania bispinosa]
MTAYTSSYKLRKQKFFRVRGVGASSNLLFGSDGTPHFPLFWSLEPHRVPKVDLNSLSEEDKAVVEWLREKDLIDCSALLENEDNPVGLQTLLGNMPPKSQTTKTMDEVAMLETLRDREKKTTVAEKVNLHSADHLGTGAAQGEGRTSSSQRKKQKVDDGCATSEVGSIFYRRFPIEQIVEKHLNRKEYRARVHKAGMRHLGKKLQSSGAQMAFFGLCVDQYVASVEKEMKNVLLKNNNLAEKLKNVEGDIKTVERLKTDLLASEKKNNDLIAKKATWDKFIPFMSSSEKEITGDLPFFLSEISALTDITDLTHFFRAELVSPPPQNPPAIVVTTPLISSGSSFSSRRLSSLLRLL